MGLTYLSLMLYYSRASSGTYKFLTFKGPEKHSVLNLGILTQDHWKIEVTPSLCYINVHRQRDFLPGKYSATMF